MVLKAARGTFHGSPRECAGLQRADRVDFDPRVQTSLADLEAYRGAGLTRVVVSDADPQQMAARRQFRPFGRQARSLDRGVFHYGAGHIHPDRADLVFDADRGHVDRHAAIGLDLDIEVDGRGQRRAAGRGDADQRAVGLGDV